MGRRPLFLLAFFKKLYKEESEGPKAPNESYRQVFTLLAIDGRPKGFGEAKRLKAFSLGQLLPKAKCLAY